MGLAAAMYTAENVGPVADAGEDLTSETTDVALGRFGKL